MTEPTLHAIHGPTPSILVGFRRLIETGAPERALEETRHQDAPWALPVHGLLLQGLTAEALAEIARMLGAFETVPGAGPCPTCGATHAPLVWAFDATGLLDDPDDWGDGIEGYLAHEPPFEAAVELVCPECGHSTGTSTEASGAEALAKALACWRDEDEDGAVGADEETAHE